VTVQWIPEHEADVAVLEEPEHLNWYHHGRRWTDKFSHVVGIMHTNYLDYARREEGGNFKETLLRAINSWVCRAHTHKVIKLSDAVQRLPRQCTHFVHGVSPKFLEVGAQKSEAALEAAADVKKRSREVWPKGAYFLGKVVWAKGYTELLGLLEAHKAKTGTDFPMDVYGSGDDKLVRFLCLQLAA
jgi:digalactosyldiacylglycerol synthase